MGKNAELARIWGGDNDAIWLAPAGTDTSGIDLDTDLTQVAGFEDVGWLETDTGITESATGSVEKIRGHQGNRVVRTRVTEGGTTVAFVALEDKAQTRSLRYDIATATSGAGMRHEVRRPGQKVSRRVAVIDKFDADDDTIKERYVIPLLEIAANGDRQMVNSTIAGYPFIGEIIGDYDVYSTDVENEVIGS